MTGSITRGHRLKLYKQQSRLDVRKYSFLMRIDNPWNVVMSARTIVSFEAKLNIEWRNQPMKWSSQAVIIWIWTKRKYFLRPEVSMMMMMNNNNKLWLSVYTHWATQQLSDISLSWRSHWSNMPSIQGRGRNINITFYITCFQHILFWCSARMLWRLHSWILAAGGWGPEKGRAVNSSAVC